MFDRLKSSTFKEVNAIFLAMKAYGIILANKSFKWHSDSQSCVSIIQACSSKLELQKMALEEFESCLK
jgi:hypothetical protein